MSRLRSSLSVNHLRFVEGDTELARLYGIDDDFRVCRDD